MPSSAAFRNRLHYIPKYRSGWAADGGDVPVSMRPFARYLFRNDSSSAFDDDTGQSGTLDLTTVAAPGVLTGPSSGKRATHQGRWSQADAAFRLTGAMSFVAVVRVDGGEPGRVAGYLDVLTQCGSGASTATNLLWTFGVRDRKYLYYDHQGRVITSDSIMIMHKEWTQLAFTRSAAGVVRFNIDGVEVLSSAGANPTGGSLSTMMLGGFNAGWTPGNDYGGWHWDSYIEQAAFYTTELTEGQLAWIASITLGKQTLYENFTAPVGS